MCKSIERSKSTGNRTSNKEHRQGRPFFDVVHSAFLLPITASPTLQGTLKDGFREAVVSRDISEPCEFPSLEPEEAPVDP